MAEAAAAIDRASLAVWARGGDKTPPRPRAAERFARRCAVDWLAGVLGADRGGHAGQAARAQVTLLAWVICGADWRRASRAAGYASGHSAAESFGHGKVWGRLEVAAVGRQTERERDLVRALQVAGLAAGAAVKGQRAVASGATARGMAGYARVTTSQGGGRLSRQQAERRTLIVSPVAEAWRGASDARARAVDAARALRRAINAERACKAARWRVASNGLRSGANR